ncbi:MAG: formylglycine-generating enzyme family protein [Elusimicrobia bacterium]|nr:formylglycine-generating enzyme family protein [Elusimicrobiota bacterium]
MGTISTPQPAGSVRKAGPVIAALGLLGALASAPLFNQQPAFEVTSLPAVPEAESPQPWDASAVSGLDAAAREEYRAVVELDRSPATPDDKARRWRRFARAAPEYAALAEKRASEWELRATRGQAVNEARQMRIAARRADWEKLEPLLADGGIPETRKARWTNEFLGAYWKSPGLDPVMARRLAAHLAADAAAMREALDALAAGAPEDAAPARPAAGASGRGSMARIPAGEFWMGSPQGVGGSDEHPRHKVYLDAFDMDRTPVTVAQYREFSRAAGRAMREQFPHTGDGHPVVNVGWDDAEAYCRWAGKRLPTEAEWEKAARGGTDTAYSFGDDERGLGDHAWYDANSGNWPHPVGQKKPNPYGLYDMAGDVWEWVSDWYDPDYYRISPGRNPQGPPTGAQHARRGGSWDNDAYRCRPASRGFLPGPIQRNSNWGFRCARR